MSRWGGREAQVLLQVVLAEYGTFCHLERFYGCGGVIRMDLSPGHADGPSTDHMIPRHHGGDDSLDNLRPAHMRCNSRRRDRPLVELESELARLGVTERSARFFSG